MQVVEYQVYCVYDITYIKYIEKQSMMFTEMKEITLGIYKNKGFL